MNERDAIEREIKSNQERREDHLSFLQGSSLLQPIQHKEFRVENQVEVWCRREVNGKMVDTRILIASTNFVARMATKALTFTQKHIEKGGDIS